MKNSFSFTLVEQSETKTEVIVLAENKDIIENILESYDFEYVIKNKTTFVIEENIDDIHYDLTDFEESDSEMLLEEEEGFYVTPMDDIYEIIATSEYRPEAASDYLLEGTAKRTVAVRGGKRKILFKCAPGQMKVGRTCRRRPTAQLNKMKRRARITARKTRRKRRLAARKRKISLRRRAVLVRKKPTHK